MRRILIGCLAAATLVGCGSSGAESAEERRRAQLCEQAEQALQEAARDAPQPFPEEEARRLIRESCAKGEFGQAVPTAEPTGLEPSPGCAADQKPGTGSARPQRRTATPPKRKLPFFARRTGSLPADGAATVAGVPLPPGSRCGGIWASDLPIDDAVELPSQIAAAFGHTGLWPVLWYAQEDPDPYMQGPDDEGAGIDDGSAEEILRKLWEDGTHPSVRPARKPFGDTFPGLAEGSAGVRTGAAARHPFRTVARTPSRERGSDKPYLLLVPVNRPADVPALLGVGLTDDITSDHAVSTVLRSWEERFGAVLTELDLSSLVLVVDRPPAGEQEALKLAAEHAAIAPQPDGGRAGTVRDVAGMLLRGRPVSRDWAPELRLNPRLWELGWFD